MSSLLREVFEDRSAVESDEAAHQARLAAVHRRIVHARRRRVAAAGAAVAAIAVLVGVVTPGVGDRGHVPDRPVGDVPAVTPSPTARTIEGFPEYLDGARVVAAASTSFPDAAVTLTFVPRTADLVFFTRCDPPHVDADLIFPDGASMSGRCGSSRRGFSEEWLASLGIRVGRPATLRLEATGTLPPVGRARPGPLPASGSIAVAVGERVPFDEYPLPPRPEILPPLATPTSADTSVRSVPGDPLAPRTVRLTTRTKLTFQAQLQTPGSLTVRADGRDITTCVKWDYAPTSPKPSRAEIDNGCYEELIPGDRDKPAGKVITITVEPRHVTGDWAVQVSY